MYLISGHYRQPLAFSEEVLEQAQARVAGSGSSADVSGQARPIHVTQITCARSATTSSMRSQTTSTRH